MRTEEVLYRHAERQVSDFVTVPDWVDQDIELGQLAAILEGGCASGAYMPAVSYYDAGQTMAKHGDEVLTYIQDTYDELPAPSPDESWSGMACYYLSTAVEAWAVEVAEEVAEALGG